MCLGFKFEMNVQKRHPETAVRHNESYRDTSVSPGAKNPTFFFSKMHDSPNSTC